MKINVELRQDGYYYATDEDTYDGAPDGNNYYGKSDCEVEAVINLLDELVVAGLYDLGEEG